MCTRTLLGGLLLTVSITSAELRTAAVQDPRPLAKAVEYLEAVYGVPITYEDPPYAHPSEIADVTDQVRGSKTVGPRILIPLGGSLLIAYESVAPQRDKETALLAASAAASGLLASYQTSMGRPRFAVIQEPGSLHVVPTRFMDRVGQVQDLKPILDTTVSLSPEGRRADKLVIDLCEALSVATGQTLVPGNIPDALLARHKTAFPVSNISARSVLDKLFAEIDVPLSWQLFYDPGLNWYVLNIHPVSVTAKDE